MSARIVALKVLDQWDEERRSFMEKLVKEALVDSDLSGRDRGLVFELCYGVVRHRNTLRAVAQHFSKHPLGRADRSVRQALAMGLYQLIYLETPDHAVVDSTIEAYREAFGHEVPDVILSRRVGFLNAMLRNACGATRQLTDSMEHLDELDTVWGEGHWVRVEGMRLASRKENLSQMLAVKYSHPHDVVRLWLERHDESELIPVMCFNNQSPKTYLIMKQQDRRPEQLRRLFDLRNIEYEDTDQEHILVLKSAAGIDKLPGFSDGRFWIQDVTANSLIQMLPKREGVKLLDFCAAPGGKLATLLDRGGIEKAVACDIRDVKLELIRENMNRLQFSEELVEVREVSSDPERIRFNYDFDQITVDAPCSNSGVLNRRHEARWRYVPENLSAHHTLQVRLIKAAAKCLAPGGDLLYSTCSMEPTENTDVVYALLRSDSNMRLVEERQVLPGENGGDGGYAALLKKRES